MQKLKLVRVNNGWKFVWDKNMYGANELFYDGIECLNAGRIKQAKEYFKKTLATFPYHIDALHSLSEFSKSDKEAENFINAAVEIGLNSFPKNFKEKDKLEWVWLENRAFLRAYNAKALIILDRNKNEAIKMFNQMITWNPNDNQGVREILADEYVKSKVWDNLISLGKKYPAESMLPSFAYGLALALYKKGDKEKATKQLEKCIKQLPKCAKILLKEKPVKPKETMPRYITIGGDDQAYEFWLEQKDAWKDKEAKRWLTETIKEIEK